MVVVPLTGLTVAVAVGEITKGVIVWGWNTGWVGVIDPPEENDDPKLLFEVKRGVEVVIVVVVWVGVAVGVGKTTAGVIGTVETCTFTFWGGLIWLFMLAVWVVWGIEIGWGVAIGCVNWFAGWTDNAGVFWAGATPTILLVVVWVTVVALGLQGVADAWFAWGLILTTGAMLGIFWDGTAVACVFGLKFNWLLFKVWPGWRVWVTVRVIYVVVSCPWLFAPTLFVEYIYAPWFDGTNPWLFWGTTGWMFWGMIGWLFIWLYKMFWVELLACVWAKEDDTAWLCRIEFLTSWKLVHGILLMFVTIP